MVFNASAARHPIPCPNFGLIINSFRAALRRFPSSGATLVFGVLTVVWLAAMTPCQALPEFSRQYGVGCQTCHSIAPRLNPVGLAFQANHFNWTGEGAPHQKSWRDALPVSNLDTVSVEHSATEHHTATNLDEVTFYLARGFRLGNGRPAGFFAETLAYSTQADGRSGDLGNAFVALPLAGRSGQLAVVAGQFTPLRYQYDPVNSLTDTLPLSLADDFNGFTFTDPVPGVRLDWFDGRGKGTADGNYLTVGVPFEGHLALNNDASVHRQHGVFAHAFHRRGYATVGAFGFTHAGQHLEGLLGTHELRDNLYVLGVAARGQDDSGSTQRLSGEVEYVFSPRLALTGRLEARQDAARGPEQGHAAVAAMTYYPFKRAIWRVTAETRQRAGDRALTLFVRAQF